MGPISLGGARLSHVVIVGGGLAGLAAGVDLAGRGIAVTILETRPHLGGRAYSFVDAASGETVDNGQHAMMGCYHHALAFFERIGMSAKLRRQSHLRVAMIDKRRGAGMIAGSALPSPLHMLSGIFGYRLLERGEQWHALLGGARLMAMRRRRDPRLQQWTVERLLVHLGQSLNCRQSFWYPVAVATLNELPERACAAPFAEVMARAFFGSRRDSQFVLPQVGLSDLYTPAASSFIESRGGRVETKAAVTGLSFRDGRCCGVELRDGRRITADACIIAVPPRAAHVIHPSLNGWGELGTAPIVSVHLWLDRPVLSEDFTGLIGTSTQWLFNRTSLTAAELTLGAMGQCVSAVISAAHDVVEKAPGEIVDSVVADLRACVPNARAAQLLRAVAIKEKHATISLTPDAERRRPGARTAIPNVFLAGDWIQTGLPATIESAVLSGNNAAALVAPQMQPH